MLAHHGQMIVLTEAKIGAFWAKVDKSAGDDSCWNWKGKLFGGGYGLFSAGGSQYAHRIALILTRGEIPNGLQCLHRCDNRKCCNPAHLFLGTNADNVADKVAKGRQSRGEKHSDAVVPVTPRGEKHPKSKLKESEVIEIRRLHASGVMGYRSLAAKYGVRWQSIQGIVSRKYWTHI